MKKTLMILLTAVMISVNLFAGGSGEKKEDSGQKTIRMWTFLDPTKTDGRSVALKQIIDNFEAANPGVTVVVEPQNWSTMTAKFLASAASKTAPDVIWCLQDEMGGVLNAGALEPFENLFLKNWTAAEIEDISDAQWEFAVRDGKHYQVTLSKNLIALLYREDLFKQNNIPLPRTWDELFAAAQKLTGRDSATGIMRYGLGQSFTTESSDAQIIANMILEEQGSPFDRNGRANWANAAGRKALELTVNTIKSGITPETALTTTVDDVFLEFGAGKYAMMLGGAVRVPNVKATASFDPNAVQLMLIPSFSGTKNSPSVLTGWSVGVWSGSPEKELAGKFVEAMISPESDKLWVQVGGQAPVRKSTTRALESWLNDPSRAYLKVMSEGFSTAGWAQPTDTSVGGWKFDLNQAVQNVLVNGMSIDDALKATANQFNSRNGK
ncbi:ABC transporter substrate-binding protein [Breznakiella homolactica]|uniref:Sugar ABC transporter substrate-binding protein n=1 Tax=Breznakiella homolactica TaxID=2798577 RepID=A0A7T8B9P9_9SPIR|nr:sugar ABC transporter substrate-binding protein [Breznakiella homolactica]QQO08702.1 sugar ABC transporter substrate-binding protein [Breznakiella homolactica]